MCGVKIIIVKVSSISIRWKKWGKRVLKIHLSSSCVVGQAKWRAAWVKNPGQTVRSTDIRADIGEIVDISVQLSVPLRVFPLTHGCPGQKNRAGADILVQLFMNGQTGWWTTLYKQVDMNGRPLCNVIVAHLLKAFNINLDKFVAVTRSGPPFMNLPLFHTLDFIICVRLTIFFRRNLNYLSTKMMWIPLKFRIPSRTQNPWAPKLSLAFRPPKFLTIQPILAVFWSNKFSLILAVVPIHALSVFKVQFSITTNPPWSDSSLNFQAEHKRWKVKTLKILVWRSDFPRE